LPTGGHAILCVAITLIEARKRINLGSSTLLLKKKTQEEDDDDDDEVPTSLSQTVRLTSVV